jgi:hypothetical protein
LFLLYFSLLRTVLGGGGGGGDLHAAHHYGSVKEALLAYEAIRKPPTTAIMLNSRAFGFLETGSGPMVGLAFQERPVDVKQKGSK